MRHGRFLLVTLVSVLLAALPIGLGPSGAVVTRAVTTALPDSAPALVQTAGATESRARRSLTARFRGPTATGHLLVLSLSMSSRTRNRVISVSDGAGNTWRRAGHYATARGRLLGELWYAANAGATTRVSVHTRARAVVALEVEEFSGVAGASPLDARSGATRSGRRAASGPATGADVGDLVVGFVAGHLRTQSIRVTAAGLDARAQLTSRGHPVASVVTASAVAGSTGTRGISARFRSRMPWAAGVAMFKPTLDSFTVTAGSGTTTTAGFPTISTIRTAVTSGSAQPISLQVSGLPVGTSASFTPGTVAAGQSATLTIRTSVSTPAGRSRLTVTGTGSSATATGIVTLDVVSPPAIRAAFYYPWFPQTWGTDATAPHTNYLPVNGFYRSDDLAVVRRHVADMQYGGITLGLASWWGQGTATDKNMPTLMQAATGTGFQWAPYYEHEGVANPTPQEIADDLHYLWTSYHKGADSPLADLPGRGMPVFVYNTGDDSVTGCATVDRWNQARQLLLDQFGEHVYIDLKVFDGYRSCTGTPLIDGWHQYGPASGLHDFSTAPGDGSVSISPGYWKRDTAYGATPFLARDRARWRSDIAEMLTLAPRWQLVTTYNEWGEGTAIEGSTGCRAPAPEGTYCDWSGDGTHSDFMADLHDNPPV